MKKIAIIGPVYPFKGGISHYTSLMYRALCKKYDVKMISFKFQYPRMLYRKEQRDYENDNFKVEGTEYWIHTVNVLNWVNTAVRINALKTDMVIIQWWHPYFAPCYWGLCKCLRKTRILFVCHNVFPHERFPLDRFLTKAALKSGNCYIVQSQKDAEDLEEIIKNPVFIQTVHPTYNAFRLENLSMEEARSRLGIKMDEKVLLFFGFIREYKGLKYIIEAMQDIVSQLESVKLMIVGDFPNDEIKRNYVDLTLKIGMQKYVDIYDGYIPDREVEKFFAASDLVVLPYISATQSGIVQIAYGFEKPVIVTNVGGLPDVVENNRTGYIVEAQNAEALARAVVSFYLENRKYEFRKNIKKDAYRFSWDRMAEIIEKLE